MLRTNRSEILNENDGAGGMDISKASGATQGQKVRAVISWDSHPDTNNPPANDDLMADLDMYVYAPSGVVVDHSDSYDNSYEIVEFTAPETGTYTATISAFRFEGYKEYMAFAYAYV